MSCIKTSPVPFAILATLIGIAVAGCFDIDDQNSIGNFIENIGQTILTIAAQGQNLQPNDDNQQPKNNQEKEYLYEQITLLKEQICLLEKKLNECNI